MLACGRVVMNVVVLCAFVKVPVADHFELEVRAARDIRNIRDSSASVVCEQCVTVVCEQCVTVVCEQCVTDCHSHC